VELEPELEPPLPVAALEPWLVDEEEEGKKDVAPPLLVTGPLEEAAPASGKTQAWV
jgi:hypothetical protein